MYLIILVRANKLNTSRTIFWHWSQVPQKGSFPYYWTLFLPWVSVPTTTQEGLDSHLGDKAKSDCAWGGSHWLIRETACHRACKHCGTGLFYEVINFLSLNALYWGYIKYKIPDTLTDFITSKDCFGIYSCNYYIQLKWNGWHEMKWLWVRKNSNKQVVSQYTCRWFSGAWRDCWSNVQIYSFSISELCRVVTPYSFYSSSLRLKLTVLVWDGVVFFTVASIELCFGFVVSTGLII